MKKQKKCCVVAFVYGKKYQCFIPLYILSLSRSYPQYDVKIYIEGKLSKKVHDSVNYLKSKIDNFEIIDSDAVVPKIDNRTKRYQQVNRSKRWLLYDEDFLKYDGLYIGDIDLLIFKESTNLLEQHLKHCATFGRCFSNIARRERKKVFSIPMFIKFSIKYGLFYTINFFKKSNRETKLFSGLHFVIPKEYFPIVNKFRLENAKELNYLSAKKSNKYNLCNFVDEQFLRDVVVGSGLEDLKMCSTGLYNQETNPLIEDFRPHHGIHLGIFRSDLIINYEGNLINSNYYKSFVEQFLLLSQEDDYIYISKNFSRYLCKIINKIMKTYNLR